MQHKLSAFLVLLCVVMPNVGNAGINIFACEPEWASLAKEIGGGKAEVFSATSARQDPHHIRARPSLIAAIRKADVVICSGSELEVGWLPLLLQKAGSDVQPGQPGYIMASDHVTRLEVPKQLDRSLGDIHPGGNPHVHLNPHNILKAAEVLRNRLAQIDTANSAVYTSNFRQFSKKWQQAIKRWEEEAKGLKDIKIITHHKAWSYLVNWLDLDEVANLEVKPGIPPTASHLESLVGISRQHDITAIIRTPYDPDNASMWLSEKSGIRAVILPYTVGGLDNTDDLFKLFDRTIELLKATNNGNG